MSVCFLLSLKIKNKCTKDTRDKQGLSGIRCDLKGEQLPEVQAEQKGHRLAREHRPGSPWEGREPERQTAAPPSCPETGRWTKGTERRTS